jgi:hypothetical protein
MCPPLTGRRPPQAVGAGLDVTVAAGSSVVVQLGARTHVLMTNTLQQMSDVSAGALVGGGCMGEGSTRQGTRRCAGAVP